MNAVEIEQAISDLADQSFDAAEFPFAFLQAFGNKKTTLDRLRRGESNKSDLAFVLQTNNIHIASARPGHVAATLVALKASPATARAKAKFILATDGDTLEAEDLASGETVACAYADFPDHFGFFLPLAGITTVKAIRESSFDIRATSRLNRLYVELLKDNPDWGTADRRPDMNHFMARLIFCFFAEDTDIFIGDGLFTATVEQMSARDSSNTHEVIAELFRAMNTPTAARAGSGLRGWADAFPYVNGGLFGGSPAAPRFSRIARAYLLHIGHLDWRRINPDIFGSMIQAVADDEERGALGMHYTSVSNILKVLNPLFLDDLRARLADAGSNARKLLNLRACLSRIRVFDPACGSGNFLVIAYKEMRAVEAEINLRRGEASRSTAIPLTNFRGIEIRDFPAEIARLALIIAEYQCDVLYRGQKEALAEFLPLDAENWITCGNALRLDWLSVCPPTGTGVKHHADDLFHTPLDQAQIDFENEGGETFICGNPPYLGSRWHTAAHKSDLEAVFGNRVKCWKSLDYVAAWLMKAADYGTKTTAVSAFVATNSICQGQQVSLLWPAIFATSHEVAFAHTSFKWANLASHNAGVTVVIVGIAKHPGSTRSLFATGNGLETVLTKVDNLNAYLVPGPNVEIQARNQPMSSVAVMQFGNHPYYGASLIFSTDEARQMCAETPHIARFIRPLFGSQEFINASPRSCFWIEESDVDDALSISVIAQRVASTARARRSASQDVSAQKLALTPYRFREQVTARESVLVVPRVSSEARPALPIGLLQREAVIQDQAFALYDAPLWNMALIASRIHLVWIATVCGKLETRYRYSNTLGWNTFPVPTLTDQNKSDLTACAENILLAREEHFPATIADLYDPAAMPADLRAAHDHNDDTLERIYIGRRFRNDTERLEKLFEMYAAMIKEAGSREAAKPRRARK